MTQFKIYEGFIPELEKKLARISRKCEKYGCQFKYEQVGEQFEEHSIDKNTKVNIRYVIVEVEGTAVINDWEFAASIEHRPGGNIIDKALTDIEVPRRYWTSDTYCEHCKTRRNRRQVFLVRNTKTGKFKQVGKSCLMEYTHGLSAEFASAALEWKGIFEEAQSRPITGGGDYRRWFDIMDILTIAFGTVRAYGYGKASDNNCTRDKVNEFLWAQQPSTNKETEKARRKALEEFRKFEIGYDNETDRSDAKKALEWLKKQKEDSDYMHNLKVVALNGDMVDEGRFGILVSLIPTWSKAMARELRIMEQEKKAEEEKKTSDWLGDIGSRITVSVKEFGVLTSWSTDFGTVMLYKFVDDAGNVLIWKTGNFVDDSVKTLIGTVKEHSEFRGVKQTVVTRCKALKEVV